MKNKYLYLGLIANIVFCFCLQFSTVEAKMVVNDSEMNNDCIDVSKINQRVTIQGIAKNAKLGAVVLTCENVPIYIEGVEIWGSDILDQAIAISGTLRSKKLSPNPIVNANGEYSTGVKGDIYILENPVIGF